ncbi:hypothetical protein BGZ98_006227, partial [Dissophora globulifera]
MGIQGFWQSCRKKGQTPEVISTPCSPPSDGKVRVDVCGSHFSDVRYIYNAHLNIDSAHARLAQRILQYGIKDDLVLYVDGSPAIEKQNTHQEREQIRRGHRQRAQEQFVFLQDRLSSKKRIRKHHLTKLNKHVKAAFYWSLEHRHSFVRFMSDNGFNINLCDTEADILIA